MLDHCMEKLKNQLQDICIAIPNNSEIYFLDYPYNDNIGDLLIMKGAEDFFKVHNIIVRGRFNIHNIPLNLEIPNHCIIVLQGGGNFGDLWYHHQYFREMILQKYRDHRIVILPQSIHFKSKVLLNRSISICNKHPDLYVFIRDKGGFQFAQNHYKCKTFLSPDMAHQLWPISALNIPTKDVLNLLRTDQEVNNKCQASSDDSIDWNSLLDRIDRHIFLFFKKIKYFAEIPVELINELNCGWILKILNLNNNYENTVPVSDLWYKYADLLINKAIKLFSSYEVIKTSRLHGHLLACLMAKTNVLIDNSYGKNSTYYHTWTYKLNSSSLITSESIKSI